MKTPTLRPMVEMVGPAARVVPVEDPRVAREATAATVATVEITVLHSPVAPGPGRVLRTRPVRPPAPPVTEEVGDVAVWGVAELQTDRGVPEEVPVRRIGGQLG